VALKIPRKLVVEQGDDKLVSEKGNHSLHKIIAMLFITMSSLHLSNKPIKKYGLQRKKNK